MTNPGPARGVAWDAPVLVSGAGIAGLTFATLLARAGREVLVVERAPSLRGGGYMIDFFGLGWDVAERMDLLREIRSTGYPIEALQYVDARGRPYAGASLDRVRAALEGRYTYLLRSDLERILDGVARRAGIQTRYGVVVVGAEQHHDAVSVELSDGTRMRVSLLVGADGAHSGVRRLMFGGENTVERPLGYFVTAFHAPNRYGIGRRAVLFEAPDRLAGFYPVNAEVMDSFFLIRSDPDGPGPDLDRVRRRFEPEDWICRRVLEEMAGGVERYEDTLAQIRMTSWSKGRAVLIGDACGCPTLIAGQGAHLAMAGAYVLARELERSPDVERACLRYEQVLHPHTDAVQNRAARFAGSFVPSPRSRLWARRLAIRLALSRWFLRRTLTGFGRLDLIRTYEAAAI